MLHGRQEERRRLIDLVDSARQGRADVLVLVGEPGIGKSALLRDLLEHAEHGPNAMQVLTTAGVASEGPLPFAALHRLLRPVLDWDRLPGPQARALRVAFGQEDAGDSPVEPFVVGLATFSVITEAAADRPVLCLVDDAHWLDPASANALLFAARQLQADPVAMVFATREGHEPAFRAESLSFLRLEGLDQDAARDLLVERVGRTPPRGVVERLFAETGGNPLALLELPTELNPDEIAGATPLPTRLALTERVEQAFLDRARSATPEVQILLLVVAVDDTGRVGVVERAAQTLGATPAAWDDAERSQLLAIAADRVSVRHPLVRSAVYQAATSRERRRAHAALAHELDHDPDRQTWHRAAAADGPDPIVADALHKVGERAEIRGAAMTAVDAFERAAALSTTEAARAERLFAAARNAWAAGDAVLASSLTTAARPLADEPVLRADIDRLRGRIEVNVGSAVDAHRIFIRAAQQVAPHDQVQALEMAVAAAVAQSHGVDSGTSLRADIINVNSAPHDTDRTRCLKQLLVSARHDIVGDRAASLFALREAMQTALAAPDCLADPDLLGNLANAALHLGDDAAYRRFYELMLSAAREQIDGMRILYALQRLAFGQYVGGQWAALRASAEEAITLGNSVGQAASTAAPLAWLAVLGALQQHTDPDKRLETVRHLTAIHPPVGILAQPIADLSRWAEGVQALLAGSPADAVHHFSQMKMTTLTFMAAQDRIEAAARAGDAAAADRWIANVEAVASSTGLPWARAAADFGRAVSAGDGSSDDAVDALFQSALGHHSEADRPYDRARTQLAYGQFLRRRQRRVDARSHLRGALSTFEDLHATPWADRAREELRASGETARKRDPSTLLDLTPMELKVARLVAMGLSNKDVAAQCWVSPRTVGFHLRNIFTKLGISSRGALIQVDLG